MDYPRYEGSCRTMVPGYKLPLMRKLVLILLMFFLPLQMAAAAVRGIGYTGSGNAQPDAAMQHAAAHAEHVAHHHHDDGSTHADDSPASTEHLLDCEKHCAMGLVLPSIYAMTEVGPPTQVTPSFRSGFVPERTTSPPLRPPHAPA